MIRAINLEDSKKEEEDTITHSFIQFKKNMNHL